MRTVPLHGKKAAGRVALVDDEDCNLVMQYTWRVYERVASARYPASGPYAVTSIVEDGKNRTVQMHCLIMDRKGIDHKDHDGLNNQKSNLRLANQMQNNQNQRPQVGRSSQYKGVFYLKESGLWRSGIVVDRRRRNLGDFASELEAAYAYDAAARKWFGEFACPNFQDEPTQAMREQWHTESETRRAAVKAEGIRKTAAARAERWAQRELELRACTRCGSNYESRSMQKSLYCPECRKEVNIQYCREWRAARKGT